MLLNNVRFFFSDRLREPSKTLVRQNGLEVEFIALDKRNGSETSVMTKIHADELPALISELEKMKSLFASKGVYDK